ncbi:TetR/AcrR family transcriptional regulator [Streptomyces durbertensis]|uniref:TetR/AcrR family transcriptional regulator n=1 Tax=Streptomyces durbertensis TaxID=2448886 RepID=A0ABR6EAZ6_9ACTN|nr:ScbR family autoregulator-binding transcription factor [Streptomyces durbertensis]MBB1242423.1 TetR/AcrR family transcriptional regulator [Streptomyces durbertensis]
MAQQERALRTRAAIVRAAAEVFGEIGYEVATIADVLKAAGVTKGALYFHFASKAELAQAVIDAQATALPDLPDQPIKLQLLVDQGMLLAHMLGHDPLVQGSVRLTIEQAGRGGPDRRGPYLNWTEVTVRQLQDAQRQGELLPHVQLEDVARLLVGSFAGVQGMSKALTDYADLADRIATLYQSVLATVALPAVLGRLDMAPQRGARLMQLIEAERAEAARTGAPGTGPQQAGSA